MIKKIKSKLAVKVFIISALLMAFCCGITYFFILHFAPYIYSYTPSDVEWFADELAQELSMTDKGETAIYFSIANDTLTGDYNNEYLFHLFNSDGEEVSLTDTATVTGKQIDDYNPKETSAHYTVSFIGEERPYTLLLAKNTDKESQAVEALHKALPALTIVIVAISVLAAVFYAWYMTAPIKKISKMSKQMANMDFGSLCPVERTDEIGVLSDSLNTLSSNLSAALTELKDANQKLQADIDKERELELQRIKFFSAASHELKTPITIIKGQLQGMLCGVGRYKDRETYLAQSLEVTNSLEKMVQELLTVSRIEAPQYSCVKTHFDFTQFLRQRLAAFDDLFVQKELSVAINLLPGIYIDGDSIKLWRGCHTNDVWQPHCSFDILLQKTTLTNLVSEGHPPEVHRRASFFEHALFCGRRLFRRQLRPRGLTGHAPGGGGGPCGYCHHEGPIAPGP